MALIQQRHEQANSVIVAPPEVQIAEQAQRVIRLRDGPIENDRLVND